jgi:ADP-heptose:LPS heptosyltransferase
MRQIGNLSSSQFPVFVHQAADYAEVATLDLPSRHAVVFLAGDASDIPTSILSRVAEHLLARGLAYICTWGPDCERVHDIFDCAYVGDGTVALTLDFMSTWHSSDSFHEAVAFFALAAFPTDDACEDLSYVAILIGTLRSESELSTSLNSHLS